MQLFDKVKAQRGADAIREKVRGVAGDVSVLGLGLSDADRKTLTDNVTIVYHCAATIRFDEELKKAVLLNTRGTKLMLDLAREMGKLKVTVCAFVSGSFNTLPLLVWNFNP